MTARVAVFISGSGTNLQALIDAVKQETLDAQIVLVVSNRKAAYGLIRAEQAGIPTLYFPLKPYSDSGRSRTEYDADLMAHVLPYAPDLCVLAGWMHVFTPLAAEQFPNRMINLHPALPGAFDGKDSIQRTFDAYRRGEVTHGGCMVHYVVPEVDAGPVIAQAIVPIHPHDTLESFEARLHMAEHQLIIHAVNTALENLSGMAR